MVMLLDKYHASPGAGVVSLPLETNSTKFEISHFSVGQENLQNNEHEFQNLQTIMKHIKNIINSENRKGMLSDMKTEFEHTVQSTDINVLQEYLHSMHSVHKDYSWFVFEDEQSTCLLFLIAYHVLVASENENSSQILNVIKDKLLQFCKCNHLTCIFQLYLHMYYKNNPNEVFTNIHTVWKWDNATELNLKLAYCKNLMGAKDYKTLIQLIHHHADYFIESYELITKQDFLSYSPDRMLINVLIHILHHQGSLNNMEKVNTVETIILRILLFQNSLTPKLLLFDAFYDHILTIDNKQILGDPHIIKLIQHAMKKGSIECNIRVTILYSNTLGMKFVKCFSQIILSIPPNKLLTSTVCSTKKQYCMILLILLDIYVSCHDTCNINLVLMRLLEFRVSLLSPIEIIYQKQCYCFMGEQKNCRHGGTVAVYTDQIEDKMEYFHELFSKNDKGILLLNNNPLVTFDSVIENILWGKEELALYLQRIKDMMEMKDDARLTEISFLFFMKFIKRTNDHNAVKLYDIINFLCTFDLKPEIQDLILSGLTEYLIISCNRQYGMLSKFILDINMICSKGQFLQKLTSSITKVWLKFNDDNHDTVNDIKRVIYHCYCTVRHGSKNEKDENIEKYKDHYTFIASMEIEEEMKKLTTLTNVLLMLTLLLTASGGHHKSAELKKYLSLKYEYRDSILYLLWCSGDVEINPGPTRFTLRKLDDSEKERNWIYDMCSILVTLIKYKSFDNKNGGMWKEKPLHWPTDCLFYDPRNKPKGPGYSIDTDKKLLECLEEHCNREKVFKETTQFDDEHTKLKVKQYQKEIITWKNNRSELFEQYIWRQELDELKAAKGSLHKYRKDSECNLRLYDINLKLIFSSEDSNRSRKSYKEIVRDIAATFCRIGKGLNYLERSAGIWKKPPRGWNPNHPYYSPCNDKKGRDNGQDDKLVDNLLTYCESKNITIPSELQPLIMAWKQGKTPEITKSYTIWSNTAIVKHSLQYLELEGLLGKIHVQESLKQIGVILDKQHWKCQKITSTDNDDKSQDSGLSNTSHSSLCTVNTTANRTNSSPKILIFQTIQDNQLKKFTNLTNANLNAACDSSYCYDSHENDHVCQTEFNLDNQWNQSSKHTCVSSCRDSCSTLTRKTQSEADDKHHPISAINSSNSKYQLISSEPNLNEQLIPSTVYIHDDTSKPERKSNNISKTAKKRHRHDNDESCSEPKQLHVSEEDLPLFLQVLTSSSDNGKDIANTSPKGNSNDCKITAFSTDHLSHDSISIKSRPNLPASGKQTDQLVINKLPDTSDGKPVDSFSYTQADNENKKGRTTSDQWVNQIVNLLEEIEQDYSATVVEPSSGQTSSHRSSNGGIDNAVKNIQTTSDLDYNVKEMINLLEELDPVFISDTLETHSGHSSSHRGSNGGIDNAVKNIQTTSDLDYSEKEMIGPLEELNPDDISAILEAQSGHSSSHRNRDGEKDNAVKNIQTTSDLDYSEKEMIDLSEELDQATLETQTWNNQSYK